MKIIAQKKIKIGGKIIKIYKQLLLFVLAFAFIITICGTATAATPHTITTINSHNNSSVISTLQTTTKAKKTVSKGDPIINGTVKINEYGSIRNLSNATVTVNSTSGRILATGTTNANGYYSINFYSTDTQFKITTSYLGCNPVTNSVTVKLSSTPGDPNYYGTSNSTLTPKQAWWNGNYGSGSNIYITHYNGNYFAGEIITAVDGTSTTYTSYCIDIYTNIYANNKLLVNGPLPGTAGNLSSQIDWGAVNYVINHYSPASPGSGLTSNQEGAAIQSAIWALTTVQYPNYNPSNSSAYYHFLTAPNDANEANGGTAIRTRALAIASYAAAHSMVYPSSIIVSPKIIRIANGQPVTITATVYDNQGNPLPNTTVNFQTTSGTLSSSTGVTNSNGQVVITLSNVPYSSSVTVTASVSGNYGNLLYDDPLDPRQNLVAENILPQIVSDISIINSDVTANVILSQTTNSPVNVGNTVTYTVTATNNGPNTATGITINDIVPSGLTGVTVTPSIGTYYNGVWVIPTLAYGTSATLTISGTATANMAGTNIPNTATITAQDQYNSQSPTTTASVHVNQANLSITNTGTTPVNVGDTGTFTITATNNGSDPATNIKIKDLLPNGFTASTTTGSYDGTTWTINSLASGSTATLTFTKTNIPASMAGTTTTNHATATWTEYPSTVTIPNATIYVKQANVALSQTGNYSGTNVTFIVTATNNGPDTATNIVINDAIPAGLTTVTVTPSPGTSYSNGVWTIPNLTYLATASLNITGSAVPQSMVINNATRTNQNEYNNQPATSISSVYVPKVNISIVNYPWWYNAFTHSQQYVYVVGNAPVITVDVFNKGPDDASGVVIEYKIGNGLKYEGSSIDMGTITYDSTNNKIIWNIGNIPNGGDVLMKVFVRMIKSGTQTPDLTTVGKLIQVNQYDSNNTDNTASCALTAPKGADIAVTQTQQVYTDNGSQYVKYTITVANNGPDNATGVKITDILPGSVTWVSDTGSTAYNHNTGIWNIGNFNMGDTPKVLVITTQVQTATTGTIKNTATKTSENEYDPNYANDAQTCIFIKSGSYTPTSNISILSYPWWYNGNTHSQQYEYVVGNAPVNTVDVFNKGPDDASGVVIEYNIGNGLKYEGSSIDMGTITYDSTNNKIIWNIGNIPNGGDVLMKVFVRMIKSGTQTPDLTTVTQVIQDGPVSYAFTAPPVSYAFTAPPVSCAFTAPKGADIAVTQTQQVYTDNGSQYVKYTITVANNGPDTATGIKITDILPIELQYTSSTAPAGTIYTNNNGIWNIGTMNNGDTKTLILTAKIITTTGIIKNTATKTSENEYDPNYANDAQTLILTIP